MIISALLGCAVRVGAPGFACLEVPVQGEQLPRAEAAHDPYYSTGALLDASAVRIHLSQRRESVSHVRPTLSVTSYPDWSFTQVRGRWQPVEKPLYAPSERSSRIQKPRHCSVLALMSECLDAVLDYPLV
jgi:hypothetical protein